MKKLHRRNNIAFYLYLLTAQQRSQALASLCISLDTSTMSTTTYLLERVCIVIDRYHPNTLVPHSRP